jgi:ribosomal protein L40E
MIVCPNCNHSNPEGATQCEACYTPLPTMTTCPNCAAPVQTDATFCGQCGFNLKPATSQSPDEVPATLSNSPEFLVGELSETASPPAIPTMESTPLNSPVAMKSTELSIPPATPITAEPEPELSSPPDPVLSPNSSIPSLESESPSSPPLSPTPIGPKESFPTQLQVQTASLLHVQTNTTIELPQYLSVIHIGKPNDQIPPDLDISGFPDAEIVSRVHGDIRVEGDAFYIEDVGSSNGTYINHTPLLPGNRHRLRSGDRIALGKGDKVTFIFQLS